MSNIIITDAKPKMESWLPEEAKLLRRWAKLMAGHKLVFTLVCMACKKNVDAYDRPNEYRLSCDCKERVLPK